MSPLPTADEFFGGAAPAPTVSQQAQTDTGPTPEPNPIRSGELHFGTVYGGGHPTPSPATKPTAEEFFGPVSSMKATAAPGIDVSGGRVQEQIAHGAADAEDLNSVVKNFDPAASYDSTKNMPPLPAANVGQQLGMKNWGDANTVFKRYYPEGDMISIGGFPFKQSPDQWLYREGPDQPFKQMGPVANMASNINFRNAANVATAVTPGLAELGWLRAGGITGVATGAGDYLDYLTNRARGLSSDIDQSSALQRAGTTSLESSVPMYAAAALFKGLPVLGSAAMSGGSALYQMGRGIVTGGTAAVDASATRAGAIAINALSKYVSPELRELSGQAEEAGLPPLTIGQAGPPAIRIIARQASATSGVMQDDMIAKMEATRRALESSISKNPSLAENPALLGQLVNTEGDQLLAELPIAKLTGKSDSGIDLQQGVQAYKQNAKAHVRQLGQQAAELAGDTWVGFPMQPLKDAAVEVRRGVLAPGLENDKPVQLEPPTKQIQPFLDTIDRVGDNLGNVTDKDGIVHNAFDQFIAIRDGLYELMTNGPDVATQQQAYALWDATQRMVDQAGSQIVGRTSRGYTKQFSDAFQNFLQTYKETQDNLRVMQGIIGARDPGGTAAALVQPGRLKTLLTVKKVLTGTPYQEAWDSIVDGFRSVLQHDLGKVGAMIERLQKSDPEVLDQIMSPEEQARWLYLSKLERATKASVAGKVAEGNAPFLKIAQEESGANIARLTKQSGGVTGIFATGVRRSIYEDILNKAKVISEEGEESLDPRLLNRAIREYTIGARRDAISPVMTPQDWEFLTLLRRYSAVVGADVSSIGGSIQAGSVAAELHNVFGAIKNPARWGLAVLKMFNNQFTSSVLATPVGNQLITAALKSRTIPASLNLIAHAGSFYVQNQLQPQRQQPTGIEGEDTTSTAR